MKTLIIFLYLILTSFELFADSDGAVAFGDGFVAYTSFSKTGSGQNLNIVELSENGKFNHIARTHLPISWSKLSTKDNTIFLETYDKLYKYIFKSPDKLELISLIEDKIINEYTRDSKMKWNKQGDWVTDSGDCENISKSNKQYYLCLVYIEYSSQDKFGALIFHDKLLISRFTDKTVSSLQINTHLETID